MTKAWKKYRDAVTSFIASGRVTQAHTEDLHIYIDNFTAQKYDKSASKIISILNTEGYAQRNARTIISQIKECYREFTDDTIDGRLCEILHVSGDKLEAQGVGNEVHRLLDLWNAKIIKYMEENDDVPHLAPTDIIAFGNTHSSFGEMDIRVKCALAAYENFRKSTGLLPLATELPLISNTFSTGGTIDLLCLIDGKLVLIDYKTGELKAEHWMQQVLYSLMLKECLGFVIHHIYLFQPSLKDMRYKLEKVADIATVKRILRDCIKAHHSLTELKNLRLRTK